MEQFIDSIHSFCSCESVNRCLLLISMCSPVKQQTVQRWTQPWWLSSFPRWSSPRFPLMTRCKILAPPSSALMAFCSSSRRSVGQASRKRKGSVTDRHRHYRTQSCLLNIMTPSYIHHENLLPMVTPYIDILLPVVTPCIIKLCYAWLPHTQWHPAAHDDTGFLKKIDKISACCAWLPIHHDTCYWWLMSWHTHGYSRHHATLLQLVTP